MSIRTACSSCGKKYVLKDDFAGRKFACKECRQLVRIPAAEIENAPVEEFSQNAEPADDIIDDDAIPRRPSSYKDEEDHYLKTAPGLKKKKKKKRTQKESDDTQRPGMSWEYHGVPFSIIISLGCHALLLMWTIFLVYDNFRWVNIGGGVGQVVRMMWIAWLATEIHSGNRRGRWISIAFGCLGFVWAYYMYEFVIPIILASGIGARMPQIVSQIYFSIGLQISLWIVNLFALFMPSASSYCKEDG